MVSGLVWFGLAGVGDVVKAAVERLAGDSGLWFQHSLSHSLSRSSTGTSMGMEVDGMKQNSAEQKKELGKARASARQKQNRPV